MDAQTLKMYLAELKWSQKKFAATTGYSENQVSRWMQGADIPQIVERYLELLLISYRIGRDGTL